MQRIWLGQTSWELRQSNGAMPLSPDRDRTALRPLCSPTLEPTIQIRVSAMQL